VRGFTQALDVADVLHLDCGLPLWAHDYLAAEPLVFDRLIAEHTRQNVVTKDLRHRRNDRSDALRVRETPLGQCSGMTPERT